ncbi:hypothetical protein [Mesorhizobium sp.]|uniref:hypothetical protein n=1 Tax=Mesorhizobium sp. TaxID=1871066 RepID=UPI000FE88849|nr:hypothetical protein [Mesorhizobium sp.]RWF25104.1 MAG: hypothetical protein EOS45_30960 [Mesorhizobium sp.]TIX44038.1 MAG: hypothetical protein E5V40_00795 [Mesorhizobium sp.]
MADSDNTTPLSFVTRRRLLAATAIAIVGWERNALAGEAPVVALPYDPVLTIWREWHKVHELSGRLCDQSAQLERTLVETVGFPCATVQLPGGEDVILHSIRALHEVLGAGADAAEARAVAEAHFAVHQARWDAADERIGYSRVADAERKAGDRAEELLQALSVTPAISFAGVAAKLSAVLLESNVREGCVEFPWPQIRSAFEDVVRVGQQLFPEQSLLSEMLRPKHFPERRRSRIDTYGSTA